MNYASSVYMFVCVCLCAEKMAVVSVQIQESSADSTELQESSKKLFSGPNSPRLPFGMLFDLVNRHDDQAAYSNKLVDRKASLPLTYTKDDKITSSANSEAQNVVSGPSRNSAKTELAKELDAENERQRNGFDAKAIQANENRDKENADPFVIQTVAKRQHIYCDISKATLNMMVEYFKFGTICVDSITTSNYVHVRTQIALFKTTPYGHFLYIDSDEGVNDKEQ